MAFKDNLKQKISIDRLAEQVRASLGTPGSGRKIDKTAMRSLLDMAGYQATADRGLELYQKTPEAEKGRILVLDNELPIYHTTVSDVLLRKNPTIKEMVNIFNMKKILTDQDVAVSKGLDSAVAVQAECLADLDLSYTDADIREMAEAGKKALADEDGPGVQDVLTLFAELLSLVSPPIPLQIPRVRVLGRIQKVAGQSAAYGPVLMHDLDNHALKYFDTRLGPEEMKQNQVYLDLAGGGVAATLENEAVFDELARMVLAEAPRLDV